ncbi:VOC family protein [Ruegeria sp. 2205SS24-7]|uniref:VOC family protein n=1 Tax=Ruegeria discodermiae TaxID=3064389 RepID=UPI0027416418|nr:VOC family protein [Ruegeria sp. 2205SS24-7]MDP5220486.1 VOC family protein [Ruegeria sp. 2205SS24-7]
MPPPLSRLVLYTKRMDAMITFYETHFGYRADRREGDRIVELIPPGRGAHLMLHPAGKATREGQVSVKLVFDVPDVAAFCVQARERGLEFGAIHKADGYEFANAKDPSKNAISVSSRAFVRR